VQRFSSLHAPRLLLGWCSHWFDFPSHNKCSNQLFVQCRFISECSSRLAVSGFDFSFAASIADCAQALLLLAPTHSARQLSLRSDFWCPGFLVLLSPAGKQCALGLDPVAADRILFSRVARISILRLGCAVPHWIPRELSHSHRSKEHLLDSQQFLLAPSGLGRPLIFSSVFCTVMLFLLASVACRMYLLCQCKLVKLLIL
jgi:hypothetical protein